VLHGHAVPSARKCTRHAAGTWVNKCLSISLSTFLTVRFSLNLKWLFLVSLSTGVCSLRPFFPLPSPPCLQILDLAWRCCQVADGPGLTAAWANGLLTVVVDLPRLPVALQDPNTMTTAMSIVDAALSKVRHYEGEGEGGRAAAALPRVMQYIGTSHRGSWGELHPVD